MVKCKNQGYGALPEKRMYKIFLGHTKTQIKPQIQVNNTKKSRMDTISYGFLKREV